MVRINLSYKPGKIIVFSDLHANWEALFVLQQSVPQPLAVLCLGDSVGYGPDPHRCVTALRAGVTHAIAGPHDRAMADESTDSAGDLLAASWRHARQLLPAADRTYLAALPAHLTVTIAGVRFHLTRLQPDDSTSEDCSLITLPLAELRQRFAAVEADIILLGGPHIPALRRLDDRLIICPGSLGQPRYGVPEPTFAVWHTGRAQIHHLHYDPHVTARKLSLLPLAPEHRLHLQSVLHTGA